MTDATPTVYTAHDIPDLIATVPTLFGFTPTESLVAVATHGPRRRFGFRLRVDLPAPDDVGREAGRVVAHLRHQGAEGAIVIILTERQRVAERLLNAVRRELGEIVPIVLARADGHRYWSPQPGFPDEGIEYSVSPHHLAVVHAIAAGQEILPSRDALVERFRAPTGKVRARMEEVLDAVFAEVVWAMRDKQGQALADAGMSVVGPILDRALAGACLEDDDIARVSVWVSTIPVRDAVWDRITHDTARDLLGVLTLVAQHAVAPFEPAILCLAGFAAWVTGDGAQAVIASERALGADPEYSMARLLMDILEAGVPPTSWRSERGERE